MATPIVERTTPSPAKRQSFFSSSAMPKTSDDAPGGSSSGNHVGTGIASYYFAFLALIICAVGLCIFIVVRRRHRMRNLRAGQQAGLQADAGERRHDGGWANWNPERRQNWQGRWHGAEVSREEGLDANGEAPPAYMPKTSLEEREGRGQESGPAVPLQTLSREHAGLKPPEYSEASTSTAAGRSPEASSTPDRMV